jgi:hypothetical protein
MVLATFWEIFLQAHGVTLPPLLLLQMNAFEARKRGCAPKKITPMNIALPFSFIDFYHKMKKKDVRLTFFFGGGGNKPSSWARSSRLNRVVDKKRR